MIFFYKTIAYIFFSSVEKQQLLITRSQIIFILSFLLLLLVVVLLLLLLLFRNKTLEIYPIENYKNAVFRYLSCRNFEFLIDLQHFITKNISTIKFNIETFILVLQ